jgi:hypothetical protein
MTTVLRGAVVFGVVVVMGLLVIAGGVSAQARSDNETVPSPQRSPSPEDPRTFGTATIVYPLQAYSFLPEDNTLGFAATNGPIQCTVGVCSFRAPVALPAGAVVASIEIEACDDDAANDIDVIFYKVPAPGGSFTPLAQATSSGAPGCVFVPANATALEAIENRNNSYYVRARLFAANTIRLFNVRLFYTLEVSPAPAVATFQDVPPGHPFFQFIEALSKSGITSGCQASPPLFCPDQALTRGQMAKFLSTALGLHFAP